MSEIYLGLPKGVQGPVNLLRSLPHPPHKALVRFLNRTNTPVRVLWVDFHGKLKEYRILQHDQYFDCNTFADHAWVFKDFLTMDPMAVLHKEVFLPEPQNNNSGLRRTLVVIHRPMNSLRTLAARVVRNHMKQIIDPFFIEIPFLLQAYIVKLLLEYEDTCHSIRPLSPEYDDPILRKDFDDFQYNITLICHRLSTHAKKLMSYSGRSQGSGEVVHFVSGILSTITHVLHHFDVIDTVLDVPLGRLGPVIWKQIIFLRVHLDTLRWSKARHAHDLMDFQSSYGYLRKLVEKRRELFLNSHKDSVQRYHWEQLSILIGEAAHKKPDMPFQKIPYDIPEIIPLQQRTEWKWIELRREQLKDYDDANALNFFIDCTVKMIQHMGKLENIFQVLCILHYHLTGRQVPDDFEGEETSFQSDHESLHISEEHDGSVKV